MQPTASMTSTSSRRSDCPHADWPVPFAAAGPPRSESAILLTPPRPASDQSPSSLALRSSRASAPFVPSPADHRWHLPNAASFRPSSSETADHPQANLEYTRALHPRNLRTVPYADCQSQAPSGRQAATGTPEGSIPSPLRSPVLMALGQRAALPNVSPPRQLSPS